MLLRLAPVLLLLAGQIAVAGHGQVPDGSIPLPAQSFSAKGFSASRQLEFSRSAAWQAFTGQHGSWGVLWNEATGTPHRAFGEALRIPGFAGITVENIQDAAMTFLSANAEALKIDPLALRLVRVSEVNGRWYVSYRQTYKGLDVLFSEIEIRISRSANVVAFGSDFYPAIAVDTSPGLSLESAKGAASSGLEGVTGIAGEDRLFILPVEHPDGITYHLAYQVNVLANNPPGNYVVLVDAHTGDLLWRHNRVRYTDVAGRVTGMVQLVLPTDPFVEEGFSSEYVTIGGVQITTDSLGYYARDITSTSTLTTSLWGPSVNVNRDDGPDALFTTTVNPGDSVNILWDEADSHPAERDGFFHTNFIHDFITGLDPSFTLINYSMPCAVNINSTCNAFWDGYGINFFDEGGGCPNTAQMPDVVYHEYGHGINDKLYQQAGSGFGMINGATHEGMADVAASVIVDDSRVGRGFFGPGTVLRDLDNTAHYPENVSGDPHITGLIIGGAFWDLRESTDLETYRHLTHFAKWGTPDDLDDGTAFSEWYVETLIADDDDGNLGNGTPHMIEITAAFNLHGIGSELFFRNSFSHTPLPNTDDTLNAYVATFTLDGVPITGGEPDSVQLIYSTDNFQTSQSVDAVITGPTEYEAEIPPQSSGTLVRYYISTYDFLAGGRLNFPAAAPDSSYRFLVGTQRATYGVMYAASTGSPYGNLYTIDVSTGESSLIGSLGIREIHGMSVRPSTGELFGLASTGTSTSLYRIAPLTGDALPETPIIGTSLRAIAFGENDTLYGVSSTGSLYRVNLGTGAATLIGTTAGNLYWGLAMNPTTQDLYASVRFIDRTYRVDPADGSATLIGETGFDTMTPSLAFNQHSELYGITATNDFIGIDTETGTGTLIGTPSATAIISLAMRVDSVVLSVEPDLSAGIPESYALNQNYPNPFNPETEIVFALPEESQVGITVYNMLGQEVARVVDEAMPAGQYSVTWNGRGSRNQQLASGLYLYRMEARGENGGRFIQVRKMLLLK
jgi:hypothetical protein